MGPLRNINSVKAHICFHVAFEFALDFATEYPPAYGVVSQDYMWLWQASILVLNISLRVALTIAKFEMAVLSKMIMSETDEAAQVLGCVFLDVLPLELRLDIYGWAFHGSEVQATLANNHDSSGAQRPVVRFRHSAHFNLLLSCRRIYNEALATFWTETALTLEHPPVEIIGAFEIRSDEIAIDKYSHQLCNSLPEAAKMNIRHIRGMMLPELNGDFVVQNPTLTATALLSKFKNLATCDISPTIARDSKLASRTEFMGNIINTGFYGRFTVNWGQEPKKFLADRYGIDAAAEVVFLRKDTAFSRSPYDLKSWDAEFTDVTQFWNLSTGVAFQADADRIDAEEGFEKVMLNGHTRSYGRSVT
ncbi:hypothetical protein diail_3296 [Diaporthe ilicicola]|nr:hypothetical protein diail_3296 [Diaporthe ilicicola]